MRRIGDTVKASRRTVNPGWGSQRCRVSSGKAVQVFRFLREQRARGAIFPKHVPADIRRQG
eukprot:6661120-Pyramimonas_sp.AAC.1